MTGKRFVKAGAPPLKMNGVDFTDLGWNLLIAILSALLVWLEGNFTGWLDTNQDNLGLWASGLFVLNAGLITGLRNFLRDGTRSD